MTGQSAATLSHFHEMTSSVRVTLPTRAASTSNGYATIVQLILHRVTNLPQWNSRVGTSAPAPLRQLVPSQGVTAMNVTFRVGDHVRWNSEAGHVSGKIIKVHKKDTDYKGYIAPR